MDGYTAAQQRRAMLAGLQDKKREARDRASLMRDERSAIKAESSERTEARDLLESGIPGYFPTPPELAARMVEIADIPNGSIVLEPSAGGGAIAEAIRQAGGIPLCIEINYTLAARLSRKGFETIQGDFLEHSGSYDRIVLNPPFERGQDITHTRRAFELLNPGGIIVGIMSSGTFYRQDRAARDFQEWIKDRGWSEELPAGTFKMSGTMVTSKLIYIQKESK